MYSTKTNPFSNLQATLDRQLHYTQIMCAGMDDRKFEEKDVTRAKGRFATKEEKAAKAKEIADANTAAMAAAAPGMVELPDGKKIYKLSPEQEKRVAELNKEVEDETVAALELASTDPLGAFAQFMATLNKVNKVVGLEGVPAEAINKNLKDSGQSKASAERIKTVGTNTVETIKNNLLDSANSELNKSENANQTPEIKIAFTEKIAPVKAKATAQMTKAVATNMSEDEVRKGMVEVSKKLNSGEPSKPADVMQVLKDFATQAQANIDKNIKKAQTAGTEAKAKALAAGMGLMTKISEIANNPLTKELGSAAAVGLTAGLLPRLAGGAIGGAIAGPAGAVVGSTIGSAVGGGLTGFNVARGLTSLDPQYYTKEVENVGKAVKSIPHFAGVVGKATGLDAGLKNVGGYVQDRINETGFSSFDDIGRDLKQVGTDLSIDATKALREGRDAVSNSAVARSIKDGTQAAQSQFKKLGDEANNLKNRISPAPKETNPGIKQESVGDKIKGLVGGGLQNANSQLRQIGDGANKLKDQAGKAIGEKINEAGFSTDDIGGDLKQVGKDLLIDARETADRTGEAIKDGAKAVKNAIGAAMPVTEGDRAKADKVEAKLTKRVNADAELESQVKSQKDAALKDAQAKLTKLVSNKVPPVPQGPRSLTNKQIVAPALPKIGNFPAPPEPDIKAKYQLSDTMSSIGKSAPSPQGPGSMNNKQIVAPALPKIGNFPAPGPQGPGSMSNKQIVAPALPKIGNFPAPPEPDIKPKYQLGNAASSLAEGAKNALANRKVDTSEPGLQKLGRVGKEVGQALPGLASQARSQGVDALSNLAEGAKSALANGAKNALANRKVDTSEPGLQKLGRVGKEVGQALPGLASQARSQGADALSNLAEGAKSALANRKVDTSEPGLQKLGRTASAAATSVGQSAASTAGKVATAVGQKADQIAKGDAANRVTASEALKSARSRSEESAATERADISKSASARLPKPPAEVRKDTNPTKEGLSSFVDGIGSKFNDFSKGLGSLMPTATSSPELTAARTKAATAARSERLNIDMNARNRVNQSSVKQAATQRKAYENAQKVANPQASAREKAEKAAKTQRLAQQAQALKYLNDRLAKV